MATIGTFTRDENGAYAGTIKTLTLNVKATIKPCDRDNDKAPDHRVTANGVEFGAGWSKTARETGAEYLSLKLDDPSFTAPVYASLVQGDKGAMTCRGAPHTGGPHGPLPPGIMRSRSRRSARSTRWFGAFSPLAGSATLDPPCQAGEVSNVRARYAA
jgi:uncharacterized protein (DUF736 family)